MRLFPLNFPSSDPTECRILQENYCPLYPVGHVHINMPKRAVNCFSPSPQFVFNFYLKILVLNYTITKLMALHSVQLIRLRQTACDSALSFPWNFHMQPWVHELFNLWLSWRIKMTLVYISCTCAWGMNIKQISGAKSSISSVAGRWRNVRNALQWPAEQPQEAWI